MKKTLIHLILNVVRKNRNSGCSEEPMVFFVIENIMKLSEMSNIAFYQLRLFPVAVVAASNVTHFCINDIIKMIVYYISIPPIAQIVGYDIDKYNTGCVFKETSSIGQFCICFKLVRHKLEVSFRFYV